MSNDLPSQPARLSEPILAHVVATRVFADGVGWVELEGENVARGVCTGHFAMVARPDAAGQDALRPFAYFESPGPHRARFLLRERPGVAGSLLQAHLGTVVPVRGPLGRPFALSHERIWAVAGGMGVAAFGPLLHAPALWSKLRLFVGVRGQQDQGLLGAIAQTAYGADQPISVASDDGSLDYKGSVVALLAEALQGQAHTPHPGKPEMVLACGPSGMMEAVAQLAKAYQVRCQVSVGIAMPCGTGTCGRCAHTGASGQSLLACVQGPTYWAEELYGPAPVHK